MNTLTAIGTEPLAPEQFAQGPDQTAGTETGGGFTDLVNHCMAADSDGSGSAAATQIPPSPPSHAPHAIAAALIRLMSSRATPATNVFSDGPRTKSNGSKIDRKPRESAALDPALAQVSPFFQPAGQSKAAGASGRLSAPIGITLETGKDGSSGSAPLAFALKLMPHDPPTADPNGAQAGAAQSSAASSAHERNAPSPQQTSADLEALKATAAMSLDAQQTADSAASSYSSGAISEFSSLMASASPASAASGTPPAIGQPAQQAPPPTAADALRTGVDVQSGPPAKTTAAQEIALRITRPESTSVDVHLIERAGQVHVAVRTPDPGLQTSLRQDLGTLVNSLERAGYRTEAALPHGGLTAPSPAQNASHADSQDKQESNGGWNGSGQPGRDSSGQRRQDQNQPESRVWTEAMEETK